MKIAPLGDSALTVSFTDEQADAPAGLLRRVWMSREAIEAARISSVTEVTSSYASVTVFFDPRLLLDAGLAPEEINRWMSDQIQTAASAIRKSRTRKLSHGHMVEMFVCFDTE